MSEKKSFSTETSERYSRALFEVVKEAGELEKIETDVKNFQSLLKESSEIKNFFHNPTKSIENQNNGNIISKGSILKEHVGLLNNDLTALTMPPSGWRWSLRHHRLRGEVTFCTDLLGTFVHIFQNMILPRNHQISIRFSKVRCG